MKAVVLILVFLIGFVSLPVIVGLISYSKTPITVLTHRVPGTVLATTKKYNFHSCNKSGMTLVQLIKTKKIVVLCGIHKFTGEKVSVTVDGPMLIDI